MVPGGKRWRGALIPYIDSILLQEACTTFKVEKLNQTGQSSKGNICKSHGLPWWLQNSFDKTMYLVADPPIICVCFSLLFSFWKQVKHSKNVLNPPLEISVYIFWLNFWWSLIFNWTFKNETFHLTFIQRMWIEWLIYSRHFLPEKK